MKIHELKVWTDYFGDIKSGIKTFEVRKDDRCFCRGDVLHLKEYYPGHEKYSGDELLARIVYKLPGGSFGLAEGYCALGIEVLR